MSHIALEISRKQGGGAPQSSLPRSYADPVPSSMTGVGLSKPDVAVLTQRTEVLPVRIRSGLRRSVLFNIDEIAETFWQLHHQGKSAWTFETELRPYKERF